jgi:pectate lyase
VLTAVAPKFRGEGYNTTTGGNGGTEITVSSLSELEAFAKKRENNSTPEILYIIGKIEADPSQVITIKHGANLSIIGLGYDAELYGVGLKIWDYNNVIVQNLIIHEVFYPDDALCIEECHHVWIDHNELHSKNGPHIGMDTYDGLLDIKKGSRYITVSWNYLHDHMKCMLIGHTDNASQREEDQNIRITIHHNIFENTNGRNPSLRWGAAHIFNNLYYNIDDYAIALRQGGEFSLSFSAERNTQHTIAIYNLEGKKVFSKNVSATVSGQNIVLVSLENYKQGISSILSGCYLHIELKPGK